MAVKTPKTVSSSGSLRDYLAANKKPTRLMGPVTQHLLLRPPEDRPRDVLHPSEIIKPDWCLRASYFELQGFKPEVPAANPHLRLQLVFDEGHAIHAKWQRYFREMGVLYGQWKCKPCGHTWIGMPPVKGCDECGAPDEYILYDEVPLAVDSLRISGHADGWVVGLGEDCLIEVKSIGPGTLRLGAPELFRKAEGDLDKAWNMLSRPMLSHLFQGQMYLTLVNLMGEAGLLKRDPPEEIVFIYELKMNNDYKEFRVFWDPDSVYDVVEDAKDLVYDLKMKQLPDCSNNPGKPELWCSKCTPFKEFAA